MKGETSFLNLFFNALEAHESLLHAETQAIAAQHIDTIESIIAQKEESLKSLLEAKSDIGFDPRENHEADLLIDRVIELQKRNANSFRKLHQKQSSKNSNSEETKPKPLDRRVKSAYSKNLFIPKSRLEF